MTILEEINEYKQQIYSYLSGKDFFEFVSANASKHFIKHYYKTLKKYLLGGKCIRGYLVKLGYEFCGGKENLKDILVASCAYEVFESSILAQDDIMDNSLTRRGIPSMYVALGGNHLAKSIATTIADSGFFISNIMLSSLNFDSEKIKKALFIQNQTYLKTTCGQLIDLDLTKKENYSQKEILEMYKLKTAYYTVIGPLLLGATLAGGTLEQIENLKQIGLNLGVMFQIKDDYLGIFGNEKLLGKTLCSDIIEGKKTLLTAYFAKNCTQEQEKFFKVFYGKEVKNQQQKIASLFEQTGTKQYVEKRCKLLFNKTNKLIKALNCTQETKQKFFELNQFLLNRKK